MMVIVGYGLQYHKQNSSVGTNFRSIPVHSDPTFVPTSIFVPYTRFTHTHSCTELADRKYIIPTEWQYE